MASLRTIRLNVRPAFTDVKAGRDVLPETGYKKPEQNFSVKGLRVRVITRRLGAPDEIAHEFAF